MSKVETHKLTNTNMQVTLGIPKKKDIIAHECIST